MLLKNEIQKYLDSLKRKYGGAGRPLRVYTPYKYFKGLHTKTEVRRRFLEIWRGHRSDASDPEAYRPFITDRTPRPPRISRYTALFRERWGGDDRSLDAKAEATGVPLDILQKIYDKGRAAWRTGHRVGATQEQWGYARVHSFLVLGCTAFASDASLLREAYDRMTPTARKRFFSQPVSCPASTLRKWAASKRWFQTIDYS